MLLKCFGFTPCNWSAYGLVAHKHMEENLFQYINLTIIGVTTSDVARCLKRFRITLLQFNLLKANKGGNTTALALASYVRWDWVGRSHAIDAKQKRKMKDKLSNCGCRIRSWLPYLLISRLKETDREGKCRVVVINKSGHLVGTQSSTKASER